MYLSKMKTVLLYGFEGTYTGGNEYDYHHPELNETHKCLLFVSQESSEPNFELAEEEYKKYGFTDVTGLKGKELNVDALNSDSYKGFSGFYEEALNEGSCLVYYPNT